MQFDLHRSSAKRRPKQYPLLLQAVLRSLYIPENTKPTSLACHFMRVFDLPFSTIDYVECSWSASWCMYRTAMLPTIDTKPVTKPSFWRIPRPTTVVTEFDTPVDYRLPAFTSISADGINRQRLDAIRLWRFLLSYLTGNTSLHRQQLVNAPNYFSEQLYSRLRGNYESHLSSSLYFNWCNRARCVSVSTDSTNLLLNAVAAVWPGMAVCPVVSPIVMPPSQASNTTLSGLYAIRKVVDIPREMYGLSVVSKQINTGELTCVAAFFLLTAIIAEYCQCSEQGKAGDTTAATRKAIGWMRAFTRSVVNDFEAKAGQLVALAPKTFNLE